MSDKDDCTGQSKPPHDQTDQQDGRCQPVRPGHQERTSFPVEQNLCSPFQLTKLRDTGVIDRYANEALTIGGADLNVYKLLGVHEQDKLVDATGHGTPISGGDAPNFPAKNAFDAYKTEWRSVQRGPNAITASAYIGYDFGVRKTSDQSRDRYGIQANVRKHITTVKIKQSSDSSKRATKARIERSDDGVTWYGVSVVDLPDDDCLNTIFFNDSVQMRFWRVRPTNFNGDDKKQWGVVALQMVDNHTYTDIYNIQDKVFLENRDRDYAEDPITIKGSYDMIDVTTELSKYGIELPTQTMYVMVHFSATVSILDRPLVIGDVIEVPSEAQFNPRLERIQKWMEVTDIAWSTEGYSPGWTPLMQRVILQPAHASQETQDIFGDLSSETVDDLGLQDKGDGQHPAFQDYSDVSDQIEAEAEDAVPVSGRETSSTIRYWEQSELDAAKEQGVENLQSIGQNPTALYTEDAMPPNNEPFTEGPEFPQQPSHGDYHRLTYEGLSQDIPAHLYRYSSSKGRWLFLERDRRAEFDPNKPRLQEFLTSENRRPHTRIIRNDDSSGHNNEE